VSSPGKSRCRAIFTPEIDALIIELRRLSGNHPDFDPLGKELGALMLRAREDRSLSPELHHRLAFRRAQLTEG
jgi:hypothetical protein